MPFHLCKCRLCLETKDAETTTDPIPPPPPPPVPPPSLSQDQLNAALLDAVRLNNLRAAEDALAAGAKPYASFPDGTPAAYYAFSQHCLPMLELLCRAGADVDLDVGEGRTMLHVACAAKDRELVALLLSLRANPNAVARGGVRPIHECVVAGAEECLCCLLASGAAVDAKNAEGATALLLAANGASVGIFRALLDAGARTDFAAANGWGLLHILAYRGRTDLLGEILSARRRGLSNCVSLDPDAKNSNGNTALHVAAAAGRCEAAALLLEAGRCSPSPANRNLNTPLHLACANGNQAVVSVLLDAKVDVDARNDQYQSPLHLAVAGGYSAIVDMLLVHKAELSMLDNGGNTAFHLAAARGYTNVCEQMIDVFRARIYGVEVAAPRAPRPAVEASAAEGSAPIHGGAAPAGANPAAGSIFHNIPSFQASFQTSLLGASPQGGFLRKMQQRDLFTGVGTLGDQQRRVLAVDSDPTLLRFIDRPNNQGQTPIFLAASNGMCAVVQLLLALGCSVNSRSNSGDSPVTVALKGGHRAVFETLRDAGADLGTTTNEGWNSYSMALSGLSGSMSGVSRIEEEPANRGVQPVVAPQGLLPGQMPRHAPPPALASPPGCYGPGPQHYGTPSRGRPSSGVASRAGDNTALFSDVPVGL